MVAREASGHLSCPTREVPERRPATVIAMTWPRDHRCVADRLHGLPEVLAPAHPSIHNATLPYKDAHPGGIRSSHTVLLRMEPAKQSAGQGVSHLLLGP